MKQIILVSALITLLTFNSNAQWSLDTLSESKYAINACTVNDKALFAQGSLTPSGVSGNIEIYNATTSTWTIHPLSVNRNYPATVVIGNKVIYAGGQFTWNLFSAVADIYDDASNTWTTKNLSLARKVGAAGVVGDKAIFAGGIARNVDVYMFSNKVDIYNITNNTWTKTNITQPRSEMATATTANKIAFAGGVYMSTVTWQIVPTKKVDIYDNNTATWSTALLSMARQDMSAASVGNKMLFAGGWAYASSGAVVLKDRVDIYDASTNTWTTATLSTPRYGMKVSVIGSKVYFAGGTAKSNLLSRRIDIYDSSTNTWSFTNLPNAVTGFAKVDLGNRIFYAGGATLPSNTLTKKINIYDVTTNSWSVDSFPVARYAATAIRILNKGLFAGGLTSVLAPLNAVNRVDIYTDPNLRLSFGTQSDNVSTTSISVFPNPFSDKVSIQYLNNEELFTASIFDLTGKFHQTFKLSGMQNELDLSDLKSGIYFLKIISGDKIRTIKLIKN